LHQLAHVLEQKGVISEAVATFKEAFDIASETLPADDMQLQELRVCFGGLLEVHDRFAEAEPLRKASVLFYEGAPPHQIERLEISLGRLGESYYRQGKLLDAVSVCRELLERRRERLGTQHPDVLLTMSSLARALTELAWQGEASAGNYDASRNEDSSRGGLSQGKAANEAEQLLRDVVAKGGEAFPREDWRSHEIQNRLADAIASVARFDQGLSIKIRAAKTAEAEALFRSSATALSESPAVKARYRSDCFKRLVRF
jgi:hypothetical protein